MCQLWYCYQTRPSLTLRVSWKVRDDLWERDYCISTHTHTHTHSYLRMKKHTYFLEELSPQLTPVPTLMSPLGKGTYLSLNPMGAMPPSNPQTLVPT